MCSRRKRDVLKAQRMIELKNKNVQEGFMRFLFAIVLLCLMGSGSYGERPLKVVAIEQPPFVENDGTIYRGLAIDFWNEIAQGIKEPFEFVPCSSANSCDPYDKLEKGEVDVLVGALSITMDHYEKVDFSFPFFIDKVIAITAPGYFHNFFLFFKMFILSAGAIIGLLILLFALYLHLLWYYEKKYIKDLPKPYKEGVLYLFWMHILKGSYFEIPKTMQGKLLILFHKTVFFFIFITLNATLFSFLTVTLVSYASPIQSTSDLETGKVGGITKTKPLKIGLSLGFHMVPFPSLDEAVAALEKGEVKAVLEDFAVAETYLKQKNKVNLVTAPFDLDRDFYSFAVRRGNHLLIKINMELLQLQHDKVPEKLCSEYFQKGEKNCAF